MLILTRKIGEAVEIGEGDNLATVTLLNFQGGQARIGVEAPKHVKVHRHEVAERIRAGVPAPKGNR